MAEPNDIERLRERIHRQRERLGRGEPVEPVQAEAMPPADARLLAARRQAASPLTSLGRLIADHPVLAIGLGTAVLVAGPQRSLRLARRAVRGAVLLVGVYRGASTLLGLLSPARTTADAGTIDAAPSQEARSEPQPPDPSSSA